MAEIIAQETGPRTLSPEEWEALKIASVKGVPDAQLAAEYGITGNAIRIKRFKDPTWKAAYQSGKINGNNGGNSASLAKKVAENITNSVSDLSQNNLLLANRLAGKLVSRALDASDEVPLDTVADIEKAVKIASIAGKWNQPTVAINQAFAFGDAGEDVALDLDAGDEGPVIECEE